MILTPQFMNRLFFCCISLIDMRCSIVLCDKLLISYRNGTWIKTKLNPRELNISDTFDDYYLR